ncbi:sarcosine oxidase subunit gamma [Oceanicola sp. S124]|uniref:sarcosine oxidase subunit gamma n=1 Tax=Oceanicola sp. S124 TaxID=1042378 RepID=UPI0002557A81|nr:sarcosine oxidase gamma subunit [Oceanicola sp. S124]
MTDLTPMAALGATPAQTGFGPLTLSEEGGLGLISLALPVGTDLAAIDLPLPGPGGYLAGEPSIFWMGPQQWMVETRAPGASMVRLAALPGARTTEQSDGWVSFRITSEAGPAPLLDLAAKLVNLPAEQIAPGRATRTLLHHLGCFVLRRSETEMAVLTLRSAAGSLWHALTETAARHAAGTAT